MNITTNELLKQIEDAKQGKAKIDSKYINLDIKEHIFEYSFDYAKFLSNIKYIIEKSN